MIRTSVSFPRIIAGYHRRIASRYRQKNNNNVSSSTTNPSSSPSTTLKENNRLKLSTVAANAPDVSEDAATVSSKKKSTTTSSSSSSRLASEVRRLKRVRNVGVLAHVDAGKTTVTERMLALAGVVHRVGSVDDGDTVTDYLPAERERGITIQSAAISFDWGWHNNNNNQNNNKKGRGGQHEEEELVNNNSVRIQLIDTPGHVDFGVEVNRSVAVLDGAVLVVDAVAGVQAQTETVWRALTNNNSRSNQNDDDADPSSLPCIAVINKMDKDGCHFNNAVRSLRYKLPGANPIPMQLPIFETSSSKEEYSSTFGGALPCNRRFVALPILNSSSSNNSNNNSSSNNKNSDDVLTGDFVGVVDLLHMRAVVWPSHGGGTNANAENHVNIDNVDECVPSVIPLVRPGGGTSPHDEPIDESCPVTQQALEGRHELFEALAEVDEEIEECYLAESMPSNAEFRAALRRATLAHKAVPVMAAAALKGKGVEPLLDAIADLLPSPLDRTPPALTNLEGEDNNNDNNDDNSHSNNNTPAASSSSSSSTPPGKIRLGHPLHPSLLALAFKVVHMKGRGGSGDGRVVFARIYSGRMKSRDVINAISPPSPGDVTGSGGEVRVERVGSMLKLAGGQLETIDDTECKSGDVCALVGLKTVVTGDTIVLAPKKESKKQQKKSKKNTSNNNSGRVCLAGVASPKPVLTVRLEPETTNQESRLSEALKLLAIEDPSLSVEESGSATLLSGLGELHIEVTLDRLQREFGLTVIKGSPSVSYRETITGTVETPNGTLLNFDRTVGDKRMQASVHIRLEPITSSCSSTTSSSSGSVLLSDPSVMVAPAAREFLGLLDNEYNNDDTAEEEEDDEELLVHRSELFKALVEGCKGALRRGPVGSYPMANVRCCVLDVDAEDGLAGLQAMPGALRAAAAHAVSTVLMTEHESSDSSSLCRVLEPTMGIEVTVPSELVGVVLSDLTTNRRGTIGDVAIGDNHAAVTTSQKALIHGEVPLVEIIGYATNLRSLTGGEGSFSAEYKGHAPVSVL